jgi:streptogramin lyase
VKKMMTNRALAIGLLWLSLASCGHTSATSSVVAQPPGTLARPDVVQTGQIPVNWTRFTPATKCGTTNFTGVVVGPDKNIWVTDPCGGLIRLTMSGTEKELLFTNFVPVSLTVGADKKFYMTQFDSDVIGVSDTSGNLQTFTSPSGDVVWDGGIVKGPDGNVWFVELAHIAKITTAGVITEYSFVKQPNFDDFGGITSGSDGNIWFAQFHDDAVGMIVPATGAITEYSVAGALCTSPESIIAASAKSTWTWCAGWSSASQIEIAQVTATGIVTAHHVSWPINRSGVNPYPAAITKGPNGDPWWVAYDTGAVVDYNVTNNTVTAYIPPLQSDGPQALVLGPDGNVWAATASGAIDVYIIKVLTVTPSSLTFGGIGQQQTITVAEPGTMAWTAKSSNLAVATVVAGMSNSTFTVTSTGTGKCTVKFADKIGNSILVNVTVP